MRFKVQDIPIDHFLVHFWYHRIEIPLELCDSKLLLKDVTSIRSASHACHAGQVTTISWQRLEKNSFYNMKKGNSIQIKKGLRKLLHLPWFLQWKLSSLCPVQIGGSCRILILGIICNFSKTFQKTFRFGENFLDMMTAKHVSPVAYAVQLNSNHDNSEVDITDREWHSTDFAIPCKVLSKK